MKVVVVFKQKIGGSPTLRDYYSPGVFLPKGGENMQKAKSSVRQFGGMHVGVYALAVAVAAFQVMRPGEAVPYLMAPPVILADGSVNWDNYGALADGGVWVFDIDKGEAVNVGTDKPQASFKFDVGKAGDVPHV